MWVDSYSSLISSELQAAGEHWTGCLVDKEFHILCQQGFGCREEVTFGKLKMLAIGPGKGAGQLPLQLPKILPEQSLNK